MRLAVFALPESVEDLFGTFNSYPTPSARNSPLVLKSGSLQRQGGLFRSWTREIAVLTVDGYLHVFGEEDDLGSAEERPLR